MRIDRELVTRLARLAAIDLADGEDERFAAELTRVVEHFETLRSVPDASLPPLPAPGPSPLRADGPAATSTDRPWIAANAPRTAHGHFVVPRVVSRTG